jgi:pimeloyl-ACP methyl ester carboxylesterase
MPSRVEAFAVTVRDLVLRGSHYVPEGTAPFPTAVLYHGFGGQRTEASRVFVQLARALLDSAIAVVAIDRAGHGESDGDFADTSVSVDIADALATLDAITVHVDVDPLDLHLIGISLGAVVASVVAAECRHAIRSVTMWSPAALFVDEIQGGHLQGRPIAEVDRQGYFDFRGMRLGQSFFEDARRFDVYGRARGFGGPVRVLHGDRDFIPASYAEAYANVYGAQMNYTLVTGGDHCWESVPARDLVITETVSFVANHRRSHSSIVGAV